MQGKWATNDGIYFGFGVTPSKTPSERSILEEPWTVTPKDLNRYPNPDKKESRGEGHLVTIGPNGSGKTRRLLIPNLYRLTDWSMVVVDIKGELAAHTAAYRAAQRNHRVIVVDPFGVMPKNYPRLCERHPFLLSSGFNPLSVLNSETDEFPDDAMVLAEALIRVEGREPHWSQSAQDLVAALIMYVKLRRPKTGTLADVRKILGKTASDFRRSALAMKATGIRNDCEELPVKAGRFVGFTDDNKELHSILSAALTQTRALDSRPIKADLAKGGFDFASLKREPTTVYLILPPRYLVTHSVWLRVMIASCLMPLLRSVEDAAVPVMFMLDEFAQLGQMQIIENNMALMRGYGVKLWLILQDLAQLTDLYEKRWESFIGNAGVIQSFAPQDVTTREYLSKLSGQRLYWLTTLGTSDNTNLGSPHPGSRGKSESTQYMPGPVYWPQGLGLMETGQSVLFSQGKSYRTFLPDPEEDADRLGMRARMNLSRGGKI